MTTETPNPDRIASRAAEALDDDSQAQLTLWEKDAPTASRTTQVQE